MRDLILFGMQGSGKGTQGNIIADKFAYKIFETGSQLRMLSKEQSDLGKRIKKIIDSGQLVDLQTIMDILDNFLKNTQKTDKIIFDGVPRNMEQMELFEKLMAKYQRSPIALHIKLSKSEALKRLMSRFKCVGVDTSNNPLITEKECLELGGTIERRDDDNEESIKARISIFNSKTIPVIEKYSDSNRILEVNGEASLEKVTEEIINKTA